jgi:hypothetical protein
MVGFLINSRGTTVMIRPLLGGFDMPIMIHMPIAAADLGAGRFPPDPGAPPRHADAGRDAVRLLRQRMAFQADRCRTHGRCPPTTPLLLPHRGSAAAPDFSPFNGDPEVLDNLFTNPHRIRILAPGEPYELTRLAGSAAL